jgi:hypothetical protein
MRMPAEGCYGFGAFIAWNPVLLGFSQGLRASAAQKASSKALSGKQGASSSGSREEIISSGGKRSS